MKEGDQLPISPSDMHDVHALTCYQKIAQAAYEETPLSPQATQAMTLHLQMHLKALKEQNKEKYDEVDQKIEKIKQATQQELMQRKLQEQARGHLAAIAGQGAPQGVKMTPGLTFGSFRVAEDSHSHPRLEMMTALPKTPGLAQGFSSGAVWMIGNLASQSTQNTTST